MGPCHVGRSTLRKLRRQLPWPCPGENPKGASLKGMDWGFQVGNRRIAQEYQKNMEGSINAVSCFGPNLESSYEGSYYFESRLNR